MTVGGYAALVASPARAAAGGWRPPLAFVAGGLVGGAVERLVVRPLYGRPLDAILATWGLGIVIGQLITLVFGREVQFVPSPISGTVIDLWARTIRAIGYLMVAAAIVIAALFAGAAQRHAARPFDARRDHEREPGAGLGIDSTRVRLMTFGIGCGLAALAGALITPLSSVDPNMGAALADQRLHAGDGLGRLAADARRCPASCSAALQVLAQHLHQPDPWRADHRGAGRRGAAPPAAGICPCLIVTLRCDRLRGPRCRACRAGWSASGFPAIVAMVLVVAGSWVLDTYTLNILVRALFVAITAITVDVLWGFSGTLTFGQSAFFGIGAYALAIVFTQFGFGPWQAALAFAAAVVLAAAVAGFVGWLSFYPGSTPLYASVISLVLPIVVAQLLYSGGTFTGSSSGLVGFESFDLVTRGLVPLGRSRGHRRPGRGHGRALQRRRTRAQRDARQ